MQNKKTFTCIISVLLLACFVLISFGVHAFTEPYIEANNQGAAYGSLYEVMPEATGFDTLYEVGSDSALTISSDKVLGIYQEQSGLGYVEKLSSTEGYTGTPISFTVAFSNDGVITAVSLTNYEETKDFGADYPSTYIGQDSAMANVSLVAGVTYASSAFKNAMSDGFTALIDNGLVSAGVKGDDQILTELLPTVDDAFTNAFGSGLFEKADISGGTYLVSSMNTNNGCGVAYIAKVNEKEYLIIVNNSYKTIAYDTDGNVTELDDAIYEEAINYSKDNFATADYSKQETKLEKLADSSLSEIELDGIFSTVAKAYKAGNNYAFILPQNHFGDNVINYYVVVNSNGEIVKFGADSIFVEAEFFADSKKTKETDYKDGFAGASLDTITEDTYLVTGATYSSFAGKCASLDALNATKIITGGNN